MLLAVTALASIALAPPAGASANVTVTDEATGATCDPTCSLHVTGEVKVGGAFLGFPVTFADCRVELDGDVDGSGESSVSTFLFNHTGNADCDVTACDQPWPIHFQEVGAGSEVLVAEYCIDEGGTQRRCFLTLPLTSGATHDYESNFQSTATGTNHGNALGCWVEGDLHFEGTGIEIEH